MEAKLLPVEYLLSCVSLVLLAVAALSWAVRERAWLHFRRSFCRYATLLLAISLGARLAIPADFVHAELRGPELLNAIFDVTAHSDRVSGLGTSARYAQALWELLLGQGWSGVVVLGALVGTAIVGFAAALARRVADEVAAYVVLLLGALQPLLVRTAASEEAGNFGALFLVVALWALAGLRRAGRLERRPMITMLAAAALSFLARQTFFFVPALCTGALTVFVATGQIRRTRLAMVTAVALFGAAVAATVGWLAATSSPHEDVTYAWLLRLPFASPRMFWEMVEKHPLFRPAESLPLLVAGALGGFAVVRRGLVDGWVWLVSFCVAFASSFGMSAFPGYGIEYGFRLPAFTLLLPLAGVGGSFLVARLGTTRGRRVLAGGLGVLCLVWPAVALVEVMEHRSPLGQEYDLLASGLAEQAGSVLLLPPLPPGARSHSLPKDILRRHDIALAAVGESPPPGRRAVFLVAGFCHVHCGLQLFAGLSTEQIFTAWSDGDADISIDDVWERPEKVMAAFDRTLPTGHGSLCSPPAGAGPFVSFGDVHVGRQEVPFTYYSEDVYSVGVYPLLPDTPPR